MLVVGFYQAHWHEIIELVSITLVSITSVSCIRFASGNYLHCVKSVQMRAYFWSLFSCIPTEYLSVFSPNTGKYGPEITPHLDTFRAVLLKPYKWKNRKRNSFVSKLSKNYIR